VLHVVSLALNCKFFGNVLCMLTLMQSLHYFVRKIRVKTSFNVSVVGTHFTCLHTCMKFAVVAFVRAI
jgi:hypothetical protein